MHYFGSSVLKIPRTLNVVSHCWETAEGSLRQHVQKYSPGAGEEFITETFHGELAKSLDEASQERQVAQAFLADLKNAFPDLAYRSELNSIATGLVADVTLHRRATESVTGGDIGFTIIRLQVEDHHDTLSIREYRRGILCQAKIKGLTGKWGHLSPKQKKVLPERLKYLGLLLYSYTDEERQQLNQFQWQLCDSASSLKDVEQWLKRDNFPSLTNSMTIIRDIGNGNIGTGNNKILDEIVSPAGNRALVLRIFWPGGNHPPGSQVRVYSRRQQEVKALNRN
jgi:hypothetical protein